MKILIIQLLVTLIGGVLVVHYSKIVSENKTKQFWKQVGKVIYIMFFLFSLYYNGNKAFISLGITTLSDILNIVAFILFLVLIIGYGVIYMIKKLSYEKVIIGNSDSIHKNSITQESLFKLIETNIDSTSTNIKQIGNIVEILQEHLVLSEDIVETIKDGNRKKDLQELLENLLITTKEKILEE